jgi:outer membrane biosynthesis protein TonB
MLSPELPRPTFATWATRPNSMELIVSESGSVERVRLLTPPQRMPDMMVLSRAKVWKFAPALKDGRPVRYRLVLTWEVNP